MSVRSNGRPRDPQPRGRRAGSSRRSALRFLAFGGALAVVVLVVLATVLRPLVASAVVGWADDNPSAYRIPFVADLVRADLGSALTDAAGSDPTAVEFTVDPGDTPASLAPRLKSAGLIKSERAFVFVSVERDLGSQLQAGTFLVRGNMTPDEVVTALIEARIVTVDVTFREGLRLEQLTAKLETVTGTAVDPKRFYDLVTKPPATLLADFPWLRLPKGATLEGFLYPATYTLKSTSTAEDLVRMMLQTFHDKVGEDRMAVPKSRGMTFYQIVTLASIVDKEAILDAERPLIAGVYQNRLDRGMLLQADPTVIYGNDTLQLQRLPLDRWQQYAFWNVVDGRLDGVKFPTSLAGYQTYAVQGLIPGPISTPTILSIDAALVPNTKAGYLFFVAKNDGSGSHAFARTYAEHLANLRKYGYG